MSKNDLLILGDSWLFLLHNLIKLHPNIMEILLIGPRNLLSKTHTLLLAFVGFFPLHTFLSTGSTGQLHLDFFVDFFTRISC